MKQNSYRFYTCATSTNYIAIDFIFYNVFFFTTSVIVTSLQKYIFNDGNGTVFMSKEERKLNQRKSSIDQKPQQLH